MSREEIVQMKKSAQKTRRETLNALQNKTNTKREIKSLVSILKLSHETIHLASLNIDLLDLSNII